MADRTVLIAYDGSEGAADAIRVASELFAPCAATVVNVTMPAAPVAYGVSGDVGGTTATYFNDLEPVLEEISEETAEKGAQLARDGGLDAKPESLYETSAWRGIVETAEKVDAAVIVVGARGLTGLKSALLGSTSKDVLHHTKRPVLVVHDPSDD